jgi:hypothetical protein
MKQKFSLSTLIVLFIIKTISCYANEFIYQHEYDAENNRIRTTTPNGSVLKYSYDCLNRFQKILD